MNNLSTSLIIIIACLSFCFILGDSNSRELSELIDQEYAFAQTSLNEGIKTAFLSFLSNEAIIFTPEITNGKEWHTNRESSSYILNWKPIFADISISDEMGYTTGPWEISTSDKPDNPVAFGHFVSIWKKQSDKKWKVIADIGISHSSNDIYDLNKISKENINSGSGFEMGSDLHKESTQKSLQAVDLDFAKLSKSEGLLKGIEIFASKNVRIYRDEHLPAIGKEAAVELIKYENYLSNWNPHDYVVSESGDLGYTCGTSENIYSKNNEEVTIRSTYLRIWKKDLFGKWELVLDITNPFPPPKKE